MRNPTLNVLLLKANEAYAKKNYAEALALYEQMLALDARCVEAHCNKALVYIHGLRWLDEAVRCCRKALEIDARCADAHYNLAVATAAGGDHHGAMLSYNKAVALNPEHASCWINRGISLKQLGQLVEALASYEKAVALDPRNPSIAYNMSNLLNSMNRLDEALRYLEITLALDEQHVLAHINKALILNKLEKPEEALASLNAAYVLANAGLYGARVSQANILYIKQTLSSERSALIAKASNFLVQKRAGMLILSGEEQARSAALIKSTMTQLQSALETDKAPAAEPAADAAIKALQEQFEALKLSCVRREEVSHAIRVNPRLELADRELSEILAHPKLNNYYRSFSAAFNQKFLAAMTQACGAVALNNTVLEIPISNLGQFIPVPFVSDIAQALCSLVNVGVSIYEGNRVKRLATLATGVTEMERLIEIAATQITLNKKGFIIDILVDERGWLAKVFQNLKDRLILELYDTPEKKLALVDATKILMACMSGRVDPELDLVEQFIRISQFEPESLRGGPSFFPRMGGSGDSAATSELGVQGRSLMTCAMM